MPIRTMARVRFLARRPTHFSIAPKAFLPSPGAANAASSAIDAKPVSKIRNAVSRVAKPVLIGVPALGIAIHYPNPQTTESLGLFRARRRIFGLGCRTQ